MQALSKDDFPDAGSLKPEWVPLPHLGNGAGAFVRHLNGDEYEEFESYHIALSKDQRLKRFNARVVALCASDKDGARLFAANDVEMLARKDRRTLADIADAGRKLNCMFLTEEEDQELKKNSASPADALPTA